MVQVVRFAHSGPAKAGPLTKRYVPSPMNKSESRAANRILLCGAVIFSGALLWLYALDAVTGFFGIAITGKLWLGAVLGTAVITDKIYTTFAKRKAGIGNVHNT